MSNNLMPVALSKAQVHEDCMVLINLSGGQGAQRISVSENVTLGQLGVSLLDNMTAKPEFPQAQIAQISSDPTLTPEQRVAQLRQVTDAFQAASRDYAAAGGLPIQDKIIFAVVKWLCHNKNFSESDTPGKPRIQAKDLQVTGVPLPSGEMLFNVVGTSVWG